MAATRSILRWTLPWYESVPQQHVESPASRTYTPPAESRTYTPAAEDRTYEVEAGNRTYTVPARDN